MTDVLRRRRGSQFRRERRAAVDPERTATLRPLLTALFPCGSVTGAPKIRAMELIDAVERDARGPVAP